MVLKIWVIIRKQGTLGEGAVASPAVQLRGCPFSPSRGECWNHQFGIWVPPSCSKKKRSTDQLIFFWISL